MKSIPPYKHTSCSQNSFCSKLCPEATAGWAGRGYPDAGVWNMERVQLTLTNIFPGCLQLWHCTEYRISSQHFWMYRGGLQSCAGDGGQPGNGHWPETSWALRTPVCSHHCLSLFPGLLVHLEQTGTKAEPSIRMTKINETYCKPLWNAHNIFISLLYLLINDVIIPTHAMRADSW